MTLAQNLHPGCHVPSTYAIRRLHSLTLPRGVSSVIGVAVPFEIHRGIQSPLNLWETSLMPERAIRIVKSIGPMPCIAVCMSCSQQFRISGTGVHTVESATATLQEQFDGHKCRPIDSSRESTEGK